MHTANPNRAYNEHILSEGFSYILSHKNITKVILFHNPQCSYHNVVDSLNPGNNDFYSILRKGFVRTYDALTEAGKQIFVVKSEPVYTNEIYLKCKSAAVRRPAAIPVWFLQKHPEICSVKQSDRLDREQIYDWNKVSHEVARGYKNIHFIDLEQVFCQQGECSMLDDQGGMLYYDLGHLDIKGAIYAAPFIFSKLRN